jgi:hypothetical protein
MTGLLVGIGAIAAIWAIITYLLEELRGSHDHETIL